MVMMEVLQLMAQVVLLPPIGLKKNGYGVFRMNIINNESVLRISGEIYGCIITKKERMKIILLN